MSLLTHADHPGRLLARVGRYGYGRVAPAGPWVGGWSPLGLLLIVVAFLFLTGRLR